MFYKIDNFEQKTPSTIIYENCILKCGSTINVYQIETVHDLTQFIGFGKYKNNKVGNVYIRGQNSLYNGAMIPSLYRDCTKLDIRTQSYNKRIKDVLKNVSKFKQYDRKIFEPLIQHYGIKTPYTNLQSTYR